MEIEQRRTKAGNTVHRVRWRGPEGHRRTRTFDAKNDAETFAADLQLRKRLGHLAGIDSTEIIHTVHERPTPMIPATARLTLDA